MKPVESNDISARYEPITQQRLIKNHAFDVANTALRYLHDKPFDENSSALLKGSVSVDLLGVKSNEPNAPLRINNGQVLYIEPGQTHQLETVLRTQTLGHSFTQGTADSNQIWLELAMFHDDQLVAHSGGINDQGELDPYAYMVNTYVIDRQGNRISLRNPEDMFTALYNHQIPPGAASVVHHEFSVPEDFSGDLRIEAKLLYRKFDTEYYRAFMNQAALNNDLPVVLINQASILLSTDQDTADGAQAVDWRRWNDYGIALLRATEYRLALNAFAKVSDAGRAEGFINTLRVHLNEGQLELAQQALNRARNHGSFPYPWQLDYYQGRLDFLNGRIEQALNAYHRAVNSDYPEAMEAGFDFSQDYGFLTELAEGYVQMALIDQNSQPWINKAREVYEHILAINSELSDAYYGLFRLAKMTGDTKTAEHMQQLHEYYKADDQNHDQAIHQARKKNPAADKAANRVVIYAIEPNEEYHLTIEHYQTLTGIDLL